MIRELLLLALAVTAVAQDKVEIDNAWVRVLRVNLAPHAQNHDAAASCNSNRSIPHRRPRENQRR